MKSFTDASGRPVGTKFILEGGLKRGVSEASKHGGPGRAPGKCLMATPFRSLENASFLETVPLTEAKDHD